MFNKDPPKRPTRKEIYWSNKGGYNGNGRKQQNPSSMTTSSTDNRPPVHERVILLCGPPGVGKSTLAHVVSRLAGYRVVEVNASDERTGNQMKERVERSMESQTISFEEGGSKPNLVVLDEIDGADGKQAVNQVRWKVWTE